jgi:Xaa-Pro dipeptidase
MRLTVEGCRERQRRLVNQMIALGVRVAVLGARRHVLYLTGFETPPLQHGAAVLWDDGRCLLVGPAPEGAWAVDELVRVEPSVLGTLHMDQTRRVAEAVDRVVGRPGSLVGLDKDQASAHLAGRSEGIVDLTPILAELRRRKEPDELAVIRGAIAVTEECYRRAREIVVPGVSELEVYAELYRTAVLAAGEKLPALGNDFQCGTPGGAPRRREAQGGELYILDLGVEFGGYHADNCRTFAVGGEPTEKQRAAWRSVLEVLEYVESTAVPGYACRRLYEEVKSRLDRDWPGGFFHHLGHGIGLCPHERPQLNPHWNQSLEEGDVFTVEPGVYHPDLRGGLRLEENYRVTETGVEKLTSFPLGLVVSG